MKEIENVLRQEDTVLFVGSGLSRWAGLPSWQALIEELAQYLEQHSINANLVRSEASSGDLLQAASYGFDKLTKPQIGDFIRLACRYGKAHPHEIHEVLVKLGPRCFITTNYDDLIEQSLRLWQPDRFYRPAVTNRQLTETAGIMYARATDFIFKPHGDAADSESIILTREQYRDLLPQGERYAALDALKTLLVSRPVLYLGFGLKDPDFLFLRDLLANTYKGATRDHYAIMSDVGDAETEYWKRNYGIHLLSYGTKLSPDGSCDHSALLDLLKSISQAGKPIPKSKAFDPQSSDTLLSIARYAATIERAPSVDPELAIRVSSMKASKQVSAFDRFDDAPIETFLDLGPEKIILIGLPGAGKTYALRRAAARCARLLQNACLDEQPNLNDLVIPVYVDLKLYRGNFLQSVAEVLPAALPLIDLMKYFGVKIYLDSFNEIPREYWENGSYEIDLAKFLECVSGNQVTIGSRTTDGLEKLGFPAYCLDKIDQKILSDELHRHGIAVHGRFAREVLWLLEKPFYFNLVTKEKVDVPSDPNPRDLYASLLKNITRSFKEKFHYEMDFCKALSIVAFRAIDEGNEAFPQNLLFEALRIELNSIGKQEVDPREIVNWLIFRSLLTPYSGSKLSFIHQSVTEYLAAAELAKRYLAEPQVLREKLSLTRWDQALFLALSLLPPENAEMFYRDVVDMDFPLALSAAKYLEMGREDVVNSLLSEVPAKISANAMDGHQFRIEGLIASSLPITFANEAKLRELVQLGDMIGAAAATRLVELRGKDVKAELIASMVDHCHDFNFCVNGISKALKPLATFEDVAVMRALADKLNDEIESHSHDDEFAHGFTDGVAEFLSEIPISTVQEGFLAHLPLDSIPEAHSRILCSYLWDKHSTEALTLAADLLVRGVAKAATAMTFIGKFANEEAAINWNCISNTHVETLVSIITNANEEIWALSALKLICDKRPDIAMDIGGRASVYSGMVCAAFRYCAGGESQAPVLDLLNDLIQMSANQRNGEPLYLLGQIDISWAGNEQLIVDLLRLRDPVISKQILTFGPEEKLGKLPITRIDEWLELIEREEDPLIIDRITSLFSSHLEDHVREAFVEEFNKNESRYRQILSEHILPKRSDLSTDDFSADAISFLLADLSRSQNSWYGPCRLLANTATERFVTERLLPLLGDAKGVSARNLRVVLREAGSRHGRRYVSES